MLEKSYLQGGCIVTYRILPNTSTKQANTSAVRWGSKPTSLYPVLVQLQHSCQDDLNGMEMDPKLGPCRKFMEDTTDEPSHWSWRHVWLCKCVCIHCTYIYMCKYMCVYRDISIGMHCLMESFHQSCLRSVSVIFLCSELKKSPSPLWWTSAWSLAHLGTTSGSAPSSIIKEVLILSSIVGLDKVIRGCPNLPSNHSASNYQDE